MHRLVLVLIAALAALRAPAAPPPSLEKEIAGIDAITADPNRKMLVLELMAERLGTHRNRLLLLRRQSGKSFGRIFAEQLAERGYSPEEAAAELRAVRGEFEKQWRRYGRSTGDGGSPPARPVLYIGTGVDHNSVGTFVTLTPEAGFDTRHVSLVGGVPFYRLPGTASATSGIGDAYVSGLVRGDAGRFLVGANVVVGFPTGDETRGLGAGKVTIDASGLIERRFERWRPFGRIGVANYVFNNVGYQRPYISTGNAAHFSGGVDFRAHRRVILGAGGFAVRPWGTQNVHSRMWDHGHTMPPGDGPGTGPGDHGPGMGHTGGMAAAGAQISAPAALISTPGGRMGGDMPFLPPNPGGEVPAEDLRDHGVTGWVSFRLHSSLTLNFSVSRSFPFELTTVSAGLGFDLGRLLFPGRGF